MSRALSMSLALSLAMACSGPDGPGGPADRASHGEAPGTPVTVDSLPLVAVGETPGDLDHEFHRVAAPFLLPDGTIAVPLREAATIRLFHRNGTFRETLGGPGEGPGEFRFLSTAWSLGDTVEAFDMDTRRITRFPPREAPVTIPLEPGPSLDLVVPGSAGSARSDGAGGVGGEDGGWVLVGVEAVGSDGRDRVALHRFGPDGEHRGRVAEIGGLLRGLTPQGGRGPIPLSPRAAFAAGGGELFLGETLTPRIQVLDREGTLLREIAWEVEGDRSPLRAQEAVAESVALLRGGEDPGEQAALREGIRGASRPPTLPAWAGLLVDPLGFLWVRPYDPLVHATPLGGLTSPGPGGTWLLFTREGAPAGSVEIPAGLEPTWIGEDRLVGIRRDPLGVESVRVHELQRQPGREAMEN